ncbi:hypothetical protein MBM_04328 [Drepanopeziza brunnea f. sp. 'multigermtubi' MB_m1]|uniref:Uncharacterized protein n=1 Tax=Marssonina brunnea f. sp. multigermtubi (strain MB_m1) TaxID=1072389 RepID=K1WY11_MARBU|nr:uncharacterized protein MBM_04328 [Drepanopeziza brunnea f. sp. 'multigermtubi' MB_m1]EKD17467.1 hypothetical protein MBM_04328 [Drepanopeziza brunnea f. sp. 'multigermtubi' MB_m1]
MDPERQNILSDLADLARTANGPIPTTPHQPSRIFTADVAEDMNALLAGSTQRASDIPSENAQFSTLAVPSDSHVDPAMKRPTKAATSSEKPPREELTPKNFSRRDLLAVEYAKSLLNEGDTLVFVRFPNNVPAYDSTGSAVSEKHRVHSEKLKAASPEFKRLLEDDWQQHRFKRRNKLVGQLPAGITYILDLTPPDEGDEALNLTANLSCSLGIRSWYRTEFTEGEAAHGLVGGLDETTVHPGQAWDEEPDSVSDDDTPWTASVSSQQGLRMRFEDDSDYSLEATLEESRKMYNELRDGQRGNKKTAENAEREKVVLDYCPIRHRTGIRRLLQVIEGKDPRLDSAPKVWTLAVLANYFKCPNAVVDFITSWMIADPNDKIFDILPEDCLRIGVLIENPTITRWAFTILVSEEALRLGADCGPPKSTGEGAGQLDGKGTTRFGRRRESIDEDILNSIQHAGRSFFARIEEQVRKLYDPELVWLQHQVEFGKLRSFQEFVEAAASSNDLVLEEKRSAIDEVMLNIKLYVRGRILWCLLKPLDETQGKRWDELRWQEKQIILKGISSEYIYHSLSDEERVLTRYFWASMRVLPWDQDDPSCRTNLIRMSPPADSEHHHLEIQTIMKAAADSHNIPNVSISHLHLVVDRLNVLILKSLRHENFNNGVFPGAACESPRSDTNEGYSDSEVDGVTKDRETALKEEKLKFWQRALAFRDEEIAEGSGSGLEKNVHFSGSAAGSISPQKTRTVEGPVSTTGIHGHEVNIPSESLQSLGTLGDPPQPSPRVPLDEDIGTDSPFFSLRAIFAQIERHIDALCSELLSYNEMERPSICDTLLCLSDDEYKYLPLWAGGLDDDSGGVYEMELPPVERGGAAGPGPSYHTGSTVASSSDSAIRFDDADAESMDGSSVASSTDIIHTSVGVEDGYSMDHVDRRRIVPEEDSEASYDRLSDAPESQAQAPTQEINLPIRERDRGGKGKEVEAVSDTTSSSFSSSQLQPPARGSAFPSSSSSKPKETRGDSPPPPLPSGSTQAAPSDHFDDDDAAFYADFGDGDDFNFAYDSGEETETEETEEEPEEMISKREDHGASK